MQPQMDVASFVAKWRSTTLTESAAAQSHFIDLCHALGQPAPTDEDLDGSFYTFEKGARKSGGGNGWADVWKRGHFAWEYKGKLKDLNKAFQQLLQYQRDLENPPLLVVCDMDRFEVHTNFTDTVQTVFSFSLADILVPEPTPTCAIRPLRVLQTLFTEPDALRPGKTTAQVTQDAATEFAQLARNLERRGHPPLDVAHFLMRLLFCLFAEDIPGLLPEHLFTRLVTKTRNRPDDFTTRVRVLFKQMATGGAFGVEDIPYFNGGLFDSDEALPLSDDDLAILARVGALDWAYVEPSIFGTLFERCFDPTKRAQIGAHYTHRDDILLIIEPVVMAPLRRQWADVQEATRPLLEEIAGLVGKSDTDSRRRRSYLQGQLRAALSAFVDEIAAVRVLDPACGSGNFLYVALKCLLDLWKEVMTLGQHYAIPVPLPLSITPAQLYGIEIDVFAHQLASIVVWIGYLQWLNDNGFGTPKEPILTQLDNIKHMDALITIDAEGRPTQTPWPDTEVIVGNPPFLGGKRLRTELGDAYVDRLFALYGDIVPREADLVAYWFERARGCIERKTSARMRRVGLLATQSIRMGANRRVLDRIGATGSIFWAQSDRPWVLDGAAVRVSMVGFDDGKERLHLLNGMEVASIHPDLTGQLDFTKAQRLQENVGISFMGDTKGAKFEIDDTCARNMLMLPINPNGRHNSDVVVPWANGQDVVDRPRHRWIIDFGFAIPEAEAAYYEAPFEYVVEHVKPERLRETRPVYHEEWWLHVRPRPAMRNALAPIVRFIATPRVAKHRIFTWLYHPTLPDSRLYVFARDDDYFFGILQSRVHQLWALSTSSRHGVGNDPTYNNTTCFETFPFPWPPGSEQQDAPQVKAIAAAACDLVEKRDRWLNPADASDTELKKRTLTNLYNQQPTWLQLAHERLDRVVLDAYGWSHELSEEEVLERLLRLNRRRAARVLTQDHIQMVVGDEPEQEPDETSSEAMSDVG